MANPGTIKDTIAGVMQALAAKKKASLKNGPQGLLKKVFSKKELEHIRLNYFKNGVLSLSADSASWLYAFNLKKENLLKKLRKESPAAIKEVRFYLGDKK